MNRMLYIGALLAFGGLLAGSQAAQAQTGDVRDVPDPLIIKHDGEPLTPP